MKSLQKWLDLDHDNRSKVDNDCNPGKDLFDVELLIESPKTRYIYNLFQDMKSKLWRKQTTKANICEWNILQRGRGGSHL